jgi:hypothetical protein
MSTFLLETYGMRVLDGIAGPDDVQMRVRELLAGLYPAGPFERRRDQRFPLPKLIRLVPVDAAGAKLFDAAVVVSGKQISEAGLSFFHPQPLAHRLVVAMLEKSDHTPIEFLLDVDWCRCTQLGWYESGGRFVKSE